MQNDPDLYPGTNQPQEVYSAGAPASVKSSYNGGLIGSSSTRLSVYFAMIFSGLNIVFLALAACYSVGLFSSSSATTDGASYFVSVLMVLIAGSLALTSSVVGIHLSQAQGSLKLALINRIFLITTVILAVLVLVGPVINRISE